MLYAWFRRLTDSSLFWPGIYLAALTIAELTTTLISPQIGMALHGLILTGLMLQAALAHDQSQQAFRISLALAPLIRLISLSMPLASFPLIYWYAMVGIPLFVAALLVVRLARLPLHQLGLNTGRLPWQLLVGASGFILGYIEYMILRPAPLVGSPRWEQFLLPALILLVFTGFLEEFIFRGVMQYTAVRSIGRYAILYISAIFAVLHIGYRSLWDFIFVFAVGVYFAWVTQKSGSILGVSLAHGLTNITLFLILPLLSLGAA